MELSKTNKVLIFNLSLLILNLFNVVSLGLNSLYLLLSAVGTAFIIEFSFAKIRKKELKYLNWLTTPLLFSLFLPGDGALWLAIYGAGFAVLFGKALFGGDEYYLFNPAMVGVVFLAISFPKNMPHLVNELMLVEETMQLLIVFLGALLIGFKIINWKVPVLFLGTFFFLTALGKELGISILDPLISLQSGFVLLGAFFIASDEVTMAQYPIGKIIYALSLAVLMFIIRSFTSQPDGFPYALLLANAVAPLIDKIEKQENQPIEEVGE